MVASLGRFSPPSSGAGAIRCAYERVEAQRSDGAQRIPDGQPKRQGSVRTHSGQHQKMRFPAEVTYREKYSESLFVHSGADLYGASRSLLRITTRLHADGTT